MPDIVPISAKHKLVKQHLLLEQCPDLYRASVEMISAETYLHLWAWHSDGLDGIRADGLNHLVELGGFDLGHLPSLVHLHLVLFSDVLQLSLPGVGETVQLRFLDEKEDV